jgi:hypothetical protein
MHPKLLLDVIQKQSGTLQKAVLEGVMNAIEAGATKVEVTVSQLGFSIKDNGRGFRDEQEIKLFFQTFGQPHEASEGKIWAEFRMGRGQMFAFGKNRWRTGNFEMLVDINGCVAKGENPGYDLVKHTKPSPGCSIEVELYDAIGSREIHQITQEIGKYVRYVNVPVEVNGVKVNKDPEDANWETVNDDVWMNLRDSGTNGIAVYNLGVYVQTIPRRVYGVGGTVVSKKKLTLNFARNEVLRSKCPIWKKVAASVETESVEKVVRKKKYSDDERSAMILRFLAGDDCPDGRNWEDVPILLDESGHPLTLTKASRGDWSNYTIVTGHDDEDTRIGDALQQRGLYLCLNSSVVDEFKMPKGEDFLGWLAGKMAGWIGPKDVPDFVPWKDAKGTLDPSNEILTDDEIRDLERVWLHALDYMVQNWSAPYHWRSSQYDWKTAQKFRQEVRSRRLKVGISDSALAWTDGQSYIAFERDWLAARPLMKEGAPVFSSIMAAGLLMAHEICHDDDSLTQGHDPDFYREYHDMADIVTGAASELFKFLSNPRNHDKLRKRAEKERQAATKRRQARRKALEKAQSEKKAKKKAPAKKVAAKAKPVAASPKKKAKAKKKAPGKKGRTASEVTDKREIKRIARARADGKSYSEIEQEFGLRDANGMTAVRVLAKAE